MLETARLECECGSRGGGAGEQRLPEEESCQNAESHHAAGRITGHGLRPEIKTGYTGSVKMKRARTNAYVPFSISVLQLVAILGVVLLAIDAARLLIRLVLQMGALTAGDDAV